ncbi:unnamed protein product [Medioppia subpectinata]|uniref:Uncharacterized protein n=1 Tax=Medioppia subpectinata TaxID=1979941 RepID=A0A7R9L0H5_9ACAR|nr:unnamed protein product [Medioppia subpectinata]CAG2112874.1 unnamed protein product [Medioppia subpectinata]
MQDCQNKFTMNTAIAIFILANVLVAITALPCNFDAECTVEGVPHYCVAKQCSLTPAPGSPVRAVIPGQVAGLPSVVGPYVECRIDVDCYPKGIYQKCSKSRCVPADNKICLTNDDCKKNRWNNKCRDNHCTWI